MASRIKEQDQSEAIGAAPKTRKPRKRTEYAYLTPDQTVTISNGLVALDARIAAKQEKLIAADLADMATELEPAREAIEILRHSVLSASAIRLANSEAV